MPLLMLFVLTSCYKLYSTVKVGYNTLHNNQDNTHDHRRAHHSSQSWLGGLWSGTMAHPYSCTQWYGSSSLHHWSWGREQAVRPLHNGSVGCESPSADTQAQIWSQLLYHCSPQLGPLSYMCLQSTSHTASDYVSSLNVANNIHWQSHSMRVKVRKIEYDKYSIWWAYKHSWIKLDLPETWKLNSFTLFETKSWFKAWFSKVQAHLHLVSNMLPWSSAHCQWSCLPLV